MHFSSVSTGKGDSAEPGSARGVACSSVAGRSLVLALQYEVFETTFVLARVGLEFAAVGRSWSDRTPPVNPYVPPYSSMARRPRYESPRQSTLCSWDTLIGGI